jgi:hypothetical protein
MLVLNPVFSRRFIVWQPVGRSKATLEVESGNYPDAHDLF